MQRPDNIKLPNLTLRRKLAWTILLFGAAVLFVLSWARVLRTVYGAASPVGLLGERSEEHTSELQSH